MRMPSAFHWQKMEINILGDFYDIVSSAGTPTIWPNIVVLNPTYYIFLNSTSDSDAHTKLRVSPEHVV